MQGALVLVIQTLASMNDDNIIREKQANSNLPPSPLGGGGTVFVKEGPEKRTLD